MIDSSDGDFFGAASIGAKGGLALFLAIVAIVLWIIAASNEAECEAKFCMDGSQAKLLDHECICVAQPMEGK